MCLALPARIAEIDGSGLAWVVLGDARMRVSLIMTPDAQPGDWVLVHAGFAIREVSESTALETWGLIESVQSLDGGAAVRESGEASRRAVGAGGGPSA
mgnify:CR=1 FL=1